MKEAECVRGVPVAIFGAIEEVLENGLIRVQIHLQDGSGWRGACTQHTFAADELVLVPWLNYTPVTDGEETQEHITQEWLLRRGYTIRGAARAIKRSPGHVYQVVTGQRKSDPTLVALASLPKRELSLRRGKEIVQ